MNVYYPSYSFLLSQQKETVQQKRLQNGGV